MHWTSHQAATTDYAPSTLNQRLSHLQFFAELGALPPMPLLGRKRLITGISHVLQHVIYYDLLLPSHFLTLFFSKVSTPMKDAILLQCSIGFRAGQMSILTAQNFLQNNTQLLVTPFKRCKQTAILPLSHVYPPLISNFLKHAPSPYTPVLGLTAAAYKTQFQLTMKQLGTKLTSHSARHFFSTVQKILGTHLMTIGHHLRHADPKGTTPTYCHELPAAEIQLLLKHPALFKAISTPTLVSAKLTALHS